MTARAAVSWLLAAIALTATAVAATKPWYQTVHAIPAPVPTSISGAGLDYLTGYGFPDPSAQSALIWVLRAVAALATLAAVLVALGGLPSRALTHAATLTVALIAAGTSIYVGATADKAWASGLSWLWGAAIALELLGVVRVSSGPTPASAP